MNNITHFELPADDIQRAKDFYAKLFNWEFTYMEEMEYMMFQMKNTKDENSGTGGILKRQNEMHTVTNYVNVSNIDEMASKIEEAGGKIIVPKQAVPNMGWFLHFMDTENNIMAVWQMDESAK